MNRHEKAKSKGFGKCQSVNDQKFAVNARESTVQKQRVNQKTTKRIAEIAFICQTVEQVTAENKQQPQALEKFLKLVYQGDMEQLTAYFTRYGIDSEFVADNLDSLIVEEFANLST